MGSILIRELHHCSKCSYHTDVANVRIMLILFTRSALTIKFSWHKVPKEIKKTLSGGEENLIFIKLK